MNEIKVLSRTQRIVVEQSTPRIVYQVTSVKIHNSGTVGPRGFQGPPGAGESATGFHDEALVMVIDHDLDFFPAGIKFYSLDWETELEPETLIYVSGNRIVAGWPTPTAANWIIS